VHRGWKIKYYERDGGEIEMTSCQHAGLRNNHIVIHYQTTGIGLSLSMSKSNAGSWLRGTTIRKGTTTPATRSHTPQTQTSTSIVFSGGVKDVSGRTVEYFVRVSLPVLPLG